MPTEMNAAQGEVYSVAVVIAEPGAFPEMRRGLMPTFRATLADTEQAIKEAVEDPGINRFCLTWTASAKARATVWRCCKRSARFVTTLFSSR